MKSRRPSVAGACLAGVVVAVLTVGMEGTVAAPTDSGSTVSVTSPVDLSTKIDMRAGYASRGSTVVTRNARFQVLTPGLVRMEYSKTGDFLDAPTFNVLNRKFNVPDYAVRRDGKSLIITTSKLVFAYLLDSGPFTPLNTRITLRHPTVGSPRQARPAWLAECTFGQVCQSGSAALAGGAQLAALDRNYVSPSGYVTGYTSQGGSTWTVLGAPAAPATLTVRYANTSASAQTVTLDVNGTDQGVSLQPTGTSGSWAELAQRVTLANGTNRVSLSCPTSACGVKIDYIAFSRPGTDPVPVEPASPLGGYIRSFDSTDGSHTTDYTSNPPCPPGVPVGPNCDSNQPKMQAGLLDRSGWYLLDDTRSDVWTNQGWITGRPAGDLQDGYLFGYGDDYRGALQDLAKLTGPAPLLPSNVFGNWFTQLSPQYTADQYESTVLPAFRANGVSLDQLSIDTNWKAPVGWDGWNWNPQYFPDPKGFLAWAKQQGIHVALNIHSSISPQDPKYAEAVEVAGGSLPQSMCISFENRNEMVPCGVWDWADVKQAQSNFYVQQDIKNDGVDSWWLDWCCDADFVSSPGVTPDGWINHLYAQSMINAGQRGFVTARVGSAFEVNQPAGQSGWAGKYVTGPWADHRSAIHFTGDTNGTWSTLAYEAQLTQDEASAGLPYVSHDIGSFSGPPSDGSGPRTSKDPDDLYLRWLQLGVFQPIMRLHSTRGGRLPWEYDDPTREIGDSLMQLRSQLVPYLYNLARDASQTGLPMTRALYLNYPNSQEAYSYPDEYLLGDDMLVAPVTTPGTVATRTMWFPPGTWIDWFTGTSFRGPVTKTLEMPLDRMPVFVRAGGVVPLAPSNGRADQVGSAPLTLRVYPGTGKYDLYQDAGEGLEYQHGQYANTTITTAYNDRGDRHGAATPSSTVTIDRAIGSYASQPSLRSITVQMMSLTKPTALLQDGQLLPTSSWSYDNSTHTVSIKLALPKDQRAVITQIGGQISN